MALDRMTATRNPARTRPAGSLLRRRLDAPATPIESLRIERVIVVARLLLTTIALIQLDLDPVDPPSYAPIARILMGLFAAHSISALATTLPSTSARQPYSAMLRNVRKSSTSKINWSP